MKYILTMNPYPESASPLDRPSNEYRGMLIKEPWNDNYIEVLKENQIEALYLNYAHGWKCQDYSFFERVPWLKKLHLVLTPTPDLSGIENLTHLESLSLSCATKAPIDFSGLPQLNSCYLSWWKGAKSIFSCTSLKRFAIYGSKSEELSNISKLTNLIELSISRSNLKSLQMVKPLNNLEIFKLENCKHITDFSEISLLSKLKWLVINDNKNLFDLSFLTELSELEILDLSDNSTLKSLNPIRGLKALRAITFSGTKTRIEDGDLGILEELPSLAMLMFAPRRHYTHKLIKTWNWDNFFSPDTLLKRK